MEKKNNNTIIVILLVVVGVLLGVVGTYLYFDNSNNKKESVSETKQDSTKKETTKEEEVAVPTDMNNVSQKLNEYLAYYIKYRAAGTEQANTNIIADSNNRLEIINAIYMSTNSGTYFMDGQAKYVNASDYQTKYRELYGSLDSFDNDTKNARGAVYSLANKYDPSLAANLVAWNSTWGTTPYDASFKADNVSYDKTSKLFTITGIITYTANDTSITPSTYTRKFTLTYANNGTSNYMTSLILN